LVWLPDIRTLQRAAIDVPSQAAISSDNASLTVDRVLYLNVIDPYKSASYGVEHYAFAITQPALLLVWRH